MYQEQLTQGLAVVDVLNSQSVNNASVSSLGVDMSKFKRVIFYLGNGGVGAAGTIDARLQSAASSGFSSGVHNMAGSNIAQITTNNVWASIEVSAERVQALNPGDRYVRLNLTGGGNAVTVYMLALGGEAAQKPASNSGLNTTYLGQTVVV
jgi:hypothetical protein